MIVMFAWLAGCSGAALSRARSSNASREGRTSRRRGERTFSNMEHLLGRGSGRTTIAAQEHFPPRGGRTVVRWEVQKSMPDGCAKYKNQEPRLFWYFAKSPSPALNSVKSLRFPSERPLSRRAGRG